MKPNISDTTPKALGAFTSHCRKLTFSLLLASLFFGTSKPCNAIQSSTTNKPTTVANTARELQSLIQDAETGDPLAQYLIGIHYWHEKDFEKGVLWLEKATMNENVSALYKLGKEYGQGNTIVANQKKSTQYLLRAFNHRCSAAIAALGDNYYFGWGDFPQDYQQAFKYYLLAAEHGYLRAQMSLGSMYLRGEGTTKDSKRSRFWFEKADKTQKTNLNNLIAKSMISPLIQYAETKNSQVQYLTGRHFSESEEYNPKLGTVWIAKAAAAGNMYAQHEMGDRYRLGREFYGVNKNIKRALEYYHLAEQQNYAPAQHMLGSMYLEGDDVSLDQEKGIFWSEKAASNGSKSDQLTLALNYHSGEYRFFDKETKAWSKRSFPKNLKKSFKYYRMLAEQEDAWAQYMVGSMYMNGEGVRKDFKQGILWFEKAAKNGEDLAQAELGICYYLGNKGVLQNYKKAFNYTLLAAKQNHDQAQYTIGFMYMRGQGVIEDYKSGIEWLKKSALQNNENAQYELGLCYYKGNGVLQDYTEAYAWSLLAVMNGGEDTVKSVLQHELSTQQIMTAQARAKELLKEIESTKTP